MIKHEGDDYYMEHIIQNEYLRSFLSDYDQRLTSNLDDHVKKIHRSELKHYMKTHSPIRQARENVKQMHQESLRVNATVSRKSPLVSGALDSMSPKK